MEKKENMEEPVSEESADAEDVLFGKTNPAKTTPDPVIALENMTRKQKIIYYADRVFLCFLVLLFVVLSIEIIYKVWYVVNWTGIFSYFRNLARWLTTHEEEEELLEL